MRKLIWMKSSKKDLISFPLSVVRIIGYSLHEAQSGKTPDNAKIMKGFGGAGVQEIVESEDGSTFRAVYTIALKHGVYVLHCFQKKSVKGSKTPQPDIDLIKARLKLAKQLDAEIENEEGN